MPCINPLSLIFGITLVANEKTVLCCRLYKVWNTINIAEALMFVMKSTVTNIISRVKKRTRPVQFRTKQCFKLRKYWDLLWSLMIVVDKVSFNSSFLVFYWNLFFFVFVGFKKNVYSVCLNHMNNLDLELRHALLRHIKVTRSRLWNSSLWNWWIKTSISAGSLAHSNAWKGHGIFIEQVYHLSRELNVWTFLVFKSV